MMLKKTLMAAALLIGIAFADSPCEAKDYTFTNDIPYRSDHPQCTLDVAVPAGATDSPVVVWLHGGGLTGGEKEVPAALLNGQLAVVGVGYRLSPGATVDEIVDDAAAAVAWTLDSIAAYGGDPSRVFVAGHSAGGYLTMMVALDKERLAAHGHDADALAGVAPFSGQCITHFEARNREGIPALKPTINRLAPLFHVRGDCPPMLIISADREKELYGRYEEQAYLWRMLRLCGHTDLTFYEMDGYDHGGMPTPAFPLLVEWINERVAKF